MGRFRAGFETARLDTIAEGIGMVGSAVLYDFGNKRELYCGVREHLAKELLGAV